MKGIFGWVVSLGFCGFVSGAEFPVVEKVEAQPVKAQVRRVVESMEFLGIPILAEDRRELDAALALEDGAGAVKGIQAVLDRYVLYGVTINPEMRVKVSQGPAEAVLHEQGWTQFLVKVSNEAGVTAPLVATSPNGAAVFGKGGEGSKLGLEDLWLEVRMFDSQPMQPKLSGLALEYRIIQLFSRDAGKREAKMMFHVGQGTQDIGFRNEVSLLFDAKGAREIVFRVKDEDGEPTTASFQIRDRANRVYPSQAKRLAPDFAFHPQVYRADGEHVRLPDGDYVVDFDRGPESVSERRDFSVGEETKDLAFQVERWIDPSEFGWWSGDHHIHAAGCAHYTNPTEGVHAPDMARHCMGEDLKVGANLTWGPCFDYQKQFFTGKDDAVSRYPYLLRYDIEVSGFGSHQSGHLCLLRLRNQMYPGGESKDHWPTLCLNTLKWAKGQGALVGPAHSGWGLEVKSDELPNDEVPPFNGIGACEYIADVTHLVKGPGGEMVPAVDFMSTVDTPYVWELNMWYHTLNVGYRTRISGETDFPCIYGEKVGLGRSYVKLDGELDYEGWCEGIRAGRNYVGDGRSHLMDFAADGQKMGEGGSTLRLDKPGKVTLTAKVAARLGEEVDAALRGRSYREKPYWSVERARIGDSRKVPVEVVVNGEAVGRTEIDADGRLVDFEMEVEIAKSSWVALRILPSSHTNPVFVEVGGKPIRASAKSAEWCLAGVKKCREEKRRFIAEDELGDFDAAYDHAEKEYVRLLEECRGGGAPATP